MTIQEIKNSLRHYEPKTNGCSNCWGDMHGTCTEQCQSEFGRYDSFWALINELASQSNKED